MKAAQIDSGTWAAALRSPALLVHLLAPLLLGQGIALYSRETFSPTIGLQVLALGLALYAALSLALAEGLPSRRRALALAAALALAQTLLLAAHCDRPLMPLWAGLAFALFWAHRLCRPRGGGEIVQALGFGLVLPLIGYYAQTGSWFPLSRTLFLPYILLQLAAAIALGFPRGPGAGKTLPALLGHRKAAALVVALCLAAQYQLVWSWGLPVLLLIGTLVPAVALLAAAPLRAKLDDSPAHQRAFKRLALSPGYIYALGFPLAQLWP